jgi:hypoxia up-regulated 1
MLTFFQLQKMTLHSVANANCLQVKDVRWNSQLGGLEMEMRLVNYFADQFNKQLGDEVDIRQSPKAMAKLKKQVKRTKEILSANTAAPISVESLYNDVDFRCISTLVHACHLSLLVLHHLGFLLH